MNLHLWFSNLLAWWMQVAVIAAAAGVLVRFARLRKPDVVLVYWQVLLGVCLLLPCFEPWQALTDSSALLYPGASATRFAVGGTVHRPLLPAIATVILAGVVFRLLWLSAGYSKLRSYCRHARPLDAPHSALNHLPRAIGVSPDIYISPDIDGPVTFGFWRPVVLLPDRWLDADPGCQSAIACHEYLHVRRNDWVIHVTEELVRAFLWFHPAIWWLIAEIRLAREQVVDRMAVRFTGATRPYVEALLAFADTPSELGESAPAFLRRRHLTRRIASLVEEVPMSKSRLIASLASITLCLAATGVFVVWSFPLQSVTTRLSWTAAPPRGEPYAAGAGAGVVAGVPGGIQGGAVGGVAGKAITGGINDGIEDGISGGIGEGISDGIVEGVGKMITGSVDGVIEGVVAEVSSGVQRGVVDGVAGAVRSRIEGRIKGGIGQRIEKAVSARTAQRFATAVSGGAERGIVGSVDGGAAEPVAGRQQDQQVHHVSEEDVVGPRVLQKVDPDYTQAAKDAKIEGPVVVDLEVHPDGRAHNLRIRKSLDPGLDRNALDAISKWEFAPATKKGEPVVVVATIEVNFRLQ